MRRLFLMRHAKSDSAPTQRDHGRLLNGRGRGDAVKIGEYMSRHGLRPDHALCSNAARTRETWSLLADALTNPPSVTFEARLYAADPDSMIEILLETTIKIHSLIVIAHNPGLHQLANMLIASGGVEARERLREKLPTAGLIVIDFAFDDWAKLRLGSGRLDRFITPRLIDEATD